MEDDSVALLLGHVFGMSACRGGTAVSLGAPGGTPRVAYAAAHTVVMYDHGSKRQSFLQGHRNALSCLEAPPDRSLLVSADSGPDGCMLIGWDPETEQAVWSAPTPHARGVAAMAVSGDGRTLATLSAVAADTSEQQELTLWRLPSAAEPGQQQPPALQLSSTPIPGGDVQTWVRFSPDDPAELVTNGARRVYFWRAPRGGGEPASQQTPAVAGTAAAVGAAGGGGSSGGGAPVSYYSPPLVAADFRQAVGNFMASVFVPGTSQAITSTADGDVVVWGEQGLSAPTGTRASDRRAVKVMRLHEKAIPYLGTVGSFVVTGGADGLVRFYDSVLRLSAWFEELRAGPVAAVSFSTAGQQKVEAANKLNRFVCPDFVVATTSGKLVAVPAAAFDATAPSGPLAAAGLLAASGGSLDSSSGAGAGGGALAGELLVETPCADMVDIAAHPMRPEVYVLGASGDLQRWDVPQRRRAAGRRLPADCRRPRALAVARDASFVAVGFEGGHVALVGAEGLEDIAVMRNSGQPVERLVVSSNGRLLAASDAASHVLLMALLPYKGTTHLKWEFVGRVKAHQGPVVALSFGESPSGQTRLFSLGADGRALEFDLRSTSALRIAAAHDAAAPVGGAPSALCFAPPMPYWAKSSTETLLLVADERYKVRAFNPDSCTMRATFLGPTHGGPISRLIPFRSVASGSSWLAYSTAERVVGLIAWPLVGDPELSMGVIAHPGRVMGVAVTYDGRKLLTAGEGGVINAWDIDTSALEAHATALSAAAARAPAGGAASAAPALADADVGATGADAARWEALVGDGELLEELRDLFCFVQLREAEAKLARGGGGRGGAGGGGVGRLLTGRVPASALPDLMRGAGYYPSDAEVAALMAHVRFLAGLDADAPPPAGGASAGDQQPGGARRPLSKARPASQQQQQQQQGAASAAPARRGSSGTGAAQDADEGVDFGTFLALYVNHRPLGGATMADIEAAFATLAAGGGGGGDGGGGGEACAVIDGRRLAEALQRGGDKMGADELERALQVLTGLGSVSEALGDEVTPLSFAAEVLGFNVGEPAAPE